MSTHPLAMFEKPLAPLGIYLFPKWAYYRIDFDIYEKFGRWRVFNFIH
jgi:hypothetical protein